jgi:beta-glucosidase
MPGLQASSAGAPLCIPALGEEDGPAGVADQLTGVTQLPAGVDLAATFDPSLARQYGQVIGQEEFGKGAAVNLGPTVNIDRDPRWGRSFEAFTEDPFLNASLATGEIDGVQATGEMSQVKHFAVYNQETNRNTTNDDTLVSDRVMHEIYFPAFEAAVKQAQAASAMCSYAVVNGDFACQSPFLMTNVLKEEWDFPGFVTSDYGALHSTAGGALAGLDREQPFNTYFGQPLEDAVNNGTISQSVLNTMVQRMLTEMFRFGLFDHPLASTTGATVTSPAHQAVGTQVAESGTTLLQNHGHTLPIPARNAGTVAVIGPSASASPTYGGGGSAYVVPSQTVTPLQGIQSAAGSGTNVTYAQGLPTDSSLPDIPASALSLRERGDAVRRHLQRNADRAGDRHVCAGRDQPVRLLHVDVSVAQRHADPRRSWHAACGRLLGGGGSDRRADLPGPDHGRFEPLRLGHPIGSRPRHHRRGQRG